MTVIQLIVSVVVAVGGQGSRVPAVISGNIRFYAPKGVGRFVFRVYDLQSPVLTLATSNVMECEATVPDVAKCFALVLEQLKDRRTAMHGLQQLPTLLGRLPPLPPQQQQHQQHQQKNKRGGGRQQHNQQSWKTLAWDAISLAHKTLTTVEEEAAQARMPLAERIERITKQVEFYFSDENWETDEWLRNEAARDPDGEDRLPLSLIGGFKKTKQLTTSVRLLTHAVACSPILFLVRPATDFAPCVYVRGWVRR